MPAPPPLDDAMSEVLGHLAVFVPPSGGSLPNNSVHLTSTKGRNLAIGHRRGSDYRAGLPASALTGIHMDATARFELWGDTPAAADGLMDGVHSNLLAAAPSLRALGFLKFDIAATTSAERIDAVSAWRKSSDCSLLYELRSSADDDADSYIVRIPLDSDLGERGGPGGASETVTGLVRRWDDEGAPALVVRGRRRGGMRVHGVSTLDFRPGGFTGDGVVVERLDTALAAAPTDYPTLDAFLAAVTDEKTPDRHARISFASLDAFLAALDPAGAPVFLGDWNLDSVTDAFEPREKRFDAPVILRSGRDLFAVRYGAAAFSATAIVYLRAHPSRA